MAYAPQLDEAIRLIDNQDKAGAQRVLARYLQTTPRDEYAWLWLAYILPDRLQQQQALQQCLKFFPNSQKAQHNLDSLRLGIPLERPSLPPDAPPHAYSSFFGRDLYLPGSEDEPVAEQVPQEEIENPLQPAPDFQSSLYFDEAEPTPRLVQPKPANQSRSESEWVHEEALETTITPAPQSSAANLRMLRSAAAPPPRQTRRPRKLQPLQILILVIMVLVTVAIICGGSIFLLSNPPYSNLLGCFEAVLNNEFPCPECSSIAIACPECPPAPTCAPTPVPLPSPTFTATPMPPTPTAEPTETVTLAQPTQAALALPAPLFFLSDVGGNPQVWSLSADGSSLALVTNETTPVTAFDISPVNGQVAYISNNNLLLVNPDGSSRRTLIVGEPLPENDADMATMLLGNPVWSLDGTQIAFSQGGIQVINPFTNEVKTIIADRLVNAQPNQTRIYTPLAWSPDGTRLAVTVLQESCITLGIVSATNGAITETEVLPRGVPLWNTTGTSLLAANPSPDCTCDSFPGLYQVDAATGSSTVLAGGLAENRTAFVGFPKIMPDGTLLYFYGELPATACAPDSPATTLLSMVVGVGNTWNLRMNLRADSYLMGEALWALDGSLAIIQEQNFPAPSNFGPLWILFSDGRSAIDLPVKGYNLRWGLNLP